jgi:ribosomal peptide maturation radical SAM protein 1
MVYRSKKAERVFDEISLLVRLYGIRRISSVDNILDVRYIHTLFPKLRDSGLGLELFYEVKANLRFDQLVALRAAGVGGIQPGIESLSNKVLRLMKKGCTGLQNIQLLRWCCELGIAVLWNILGGFPGEEPSSYAAMTSIIPLLTHLPPPLTCTPIRLDRFSPLFEQGAEMGIRRIRPKPEYYYVYPFSARELERLVYFFDFDYADGREVQGYFEPVQRAVGKWWEVLTLPREQQPLLDAQWLGTDELVVSDTRLCAAQPNHQFSGLAAKLYGLCDSIQTVPEIVRATNEYGASEGQIRALLQDCIDRRLMLEMEEHYLSLAVIRNRPVNIPRNHRDNSRRDEAAASEPLLRLV